MKHKRLILLTALVLLLSFCALNAGMLYIFASDLPDKAIDDTSLTPEVTTPEKEDATLPEQEQIDTPALDGTVLLTQEQLAEKFGKYTHVSEQDGKKVVTLFSDEQSAELKARKDGGELMLLTGQEMLYLLDDTKRLFENYDLICIRDPEGTMYTYPGLSYYSSAEFGAAFPGNAENVANELSYDLKKDTYEAMIYRIYALHSYAEFIRYRPEIACMYVYTEWDGFEGEDPRVIAEGIDRHATYSSRFNVAKNYAEGDRGDDNGAHPEIPQYRLNLIRSIPGGMLTFYGEEIFYIDDLSSFDGTNMVKMYPDGIFPGGTVTGKYENGNGRAVVLEVWDETSGNCVARLRLDETTDAAHVQKIAAMWNEMGSIRTRGGEKLAAVGPGTYRVAVYLCGFPHQMQESGSEQACFWYKPEADADLWSLIWWDDPMLFFSDNFVGATEMTTYINRILQEKFAQ